MWVTLFLFEADKKKKTKITRLKSTPNPEALKGTHVPPPGLRAALGLLVSVPLWLCWVLLLQQPKDCVHLASLIPIKPPNTHTHTRPFFLLFPPFLLPTFSPGEAPPPPAQSWASEESWWPKTTVKTTQDTSWVSQAFAGWSKSPDHPQGQHCFYREVTTWTKSVLSTPWPKLRTACTLVSLEQLTLPGFRLNWGAGRSCRPTSAGPKEEHGQA